MIPAPSFSARFRQHIQHHTQFSIYSDDYQDSLRSAINTFLADQNLWIQADQTEAFLRLESGLNLSFSNVLTIVYCYEENKLRDGVQLLHTDN